MRQIQGSVPPESQALYVTDNSTSTVETLRTIATHAAKLEKRAPEIVENALDNIGVVSIQDAAPLLSLPLFLDRNYLPFHPQTKLIILDNYNSSFHVRDANGNNTLMSKIGRFLQQMSRTASSYEIPVLAVNSVREDGIPPGQKITSTRIIQQSESGWLWEGFADPNTCSCVSYST
uniref:DNA recombination and repair protein Rad51-like C-terminal domain-containing protein n=1 Tax=Rhodosorus marinus TaxID=101924 RepID=A0A7S3A960_9RHOD|mmetsp:Transcript_6991/g.30654  ORF Transcript_6991/g.30654 Transcript_6991/m.30654 type:complete len:176 (+) Transcript_6991:513-1040(+)